jgi:hypothetical protein
VNGSCSGSYPMVNFNITGVETLGSATRALFKEFVSWHYIYGKSVGHLRTVYK